ncbi:MAG: hypothetical protein C5S48_05810 [Candidatus Methanogaster sp.]|nr:MAG: hypothetical protein C5S48_05810 [ANME-2 cluster archaeon]
MDKENKTEQTAEKVKRIDFTFYSNLAMVSCSDSDFFIDFMQGPPEGDALSTARIFMAPEHAKRVLKALEKVITEFEERKQVQEE